MKFAVNENSLITSDMIVFLSACANAGFKAVELSYPKLKEALRFIPAYKLRKKIKNLNIEILSLNAFEDAFLVPESGLKSVEAEARLIGELCNAVGCPAVVLPSSRWYSQYGNLPETSELISLYRNRLLLFKDLFIEYSVEVLFEPIAYPEFVFGDTKSINTLLAVPELQDIRIVPDIHNLYRNGEKAEQLKKLINKIGLFHIDDTIEGDLESLHVAKDRTFPGEGIAKAAEWIQAAEAVGYTGYYSLELFDDNLYAMNPNEAALLCRKKLDIFAESCY